MFWMLFLFIYVPAFAHSPHSCEQLVLHSLSEIKMQGWLPLDSLLQSAPRNVSHWDSTPIHGRLGMFVSVGMIEGSESQGLTHHLAQKSGAAVKSYPFWPSSHSDFKSGMSYMTANSLRLNIISEDGYAEIIEGMFFQNGAWLPFLYEFQPAKGKFVRVLTSQNGIHSVAKCTTCHGTGEEFSPIPFKNKDYQPSKGWFFSESPQEFTSQKLTSDWAVSDHESLIESIRSKPRK